VPAVMNQEGTPALPLASKLQSPVPISSSMRKVQLFYYPSLRRWLEAYRCRATTSVGSIFTPGPMLVDTAIPLR